MMFMVTYSFASGARPRPPQGDQVFPEYITDRQYGNFFPFVFGIRAAETCG